MRLVYNDWLVEKKENEYRLRMGVVWVTLVFTRFLGSVP